MTENDDRCGVAFTQNDDRHEVAFRKPMTGTKLRLVKTAAIRKWMSGLKLRDAGDDGDVAEAAAQTQYDDRRNVAQSCVKLRVACEGTGMSM